MVVSVALSSSSSSSHSSLVFEANDLRRRTRSHSRTVSCSSRSDGCIPKLEPFSRSKIDRGMKEPSFVQKAENELADYCSTLEGDASYKCWRAYLELKDLERSLKKEDVENLVLQVGGVKSLMDCLHGIWVMYKKKNEEEKRREKPFPVPDGLPKSEEELEDEKARMPDSAYTRLLRRKGRFPAWYSPAPDHETD